MAKTPAQPKWLSITHSSSMLLAAAIVLILGVMLLPLPTFLMDMLLVMNITGALVILFVALYVLQPLDFSVFPGLLLIVTLFRLSLNVATTRLILGQGYAGEVIQAFGSFVVQGNYVVGAVIFLILVIINFVVITKGATRIAEVSARFKLDAMPGKQMSIDADLNAGLIDDHEAQSRRELISKEADFYGAMDGSAKFVRGDAIAGLLITIINIVGGLTIGVAQLGLPFSEAASVYSLLTIGDGLIAQIPALIISTAAAIIITRATSESDFGSDIAAQITRRPKAVYMSSAVLFLIGIVPGLPFFPFVLMSLMLGAGGYMVERSKRIETAQAEAGEEEEPVEAEEKIETYLHPDTFEIEIGYGLIPLVDAAQGGILLKRISTIRKSIAIEVGVIVPSIRIRDNIQLKSSEYVFKIYGNVASKGEVMLDHFMVLNQDEQIQLDGIPAVDPTYGMPAMWISKREWTKAEVAGYVGIEPPAVIATHLMEVLKTNMHKLLNRQETQRMLDNLKKTHVAVVEGLVPDIIPLGVVTQVLKNLLKENIPIRNLVQIMESIADFAPFTKDPGVLTEHVRMALAETITNQLKQTGNDVVVATLEPRLEDMIIQAISNNGHSRNLGLSPPQVSKLFESIGEKVEKLIAEHVRPAILVSPQIRKQVQSFLEPVLPNVSVISYSELTPDTNLKTVGMIGYPNAA